MKYLLPLALLLTLAVPVGAENTMPFPFGKGPAVITCPSENPDAQCIKANENPQPQPPCLATMEAAMRAMEPFISISAEGSTRWAHDARSKPHTTMDMVLETERREPQHKKALKQWDAAKRECWREKP